MIAFDATANGSVLPGTSITFAHTCTGQNLILIVGIEVNGTNLDKISGVTYNGVSMTRAIFNSGSDPNLSTYIYYLINPPTGSHNVVVSLTASQFCRAVSASYTGVLQSAQPDVTGGSDTGGGTATSISKSVTTTVSNDWVISVAGGDGTGALSAGSGVNSVRGNVGSITYLGDSNAGEPVGAYSEAWTCAAQHLTMAVIAIKPIPAAANSNFLPLL